jgi:hypothetical protein
MCVHVETNVPQKTIDLSTKKWDVDGGLNPPVDCDPSKTPPELQGSSNQAFQATIDRYKKGEIDSQQISAFISQLSRTPSTQIQLCPCPNGDCSACMPQFEYPSDENI